MSETCDLRLTAFIGEARARVVPLALAEQVAPLPPASTRAVLREQPLKCARAEHKSQLGIVADARVHQVDYRRRDPCAQTEQAKRGYTINFAECCPNSYLCIRDFDRISLGPRMVLGSDDHSRQRLGQPPQSLFAAIANGETNGRERGERCNYGSDGGDGVPNHDRSSIAMRYSASASGSSRFRTTRNTLRASI